MKAIYGNQRGQTTWQCQHGTDTANGTLYQSYFSRDANTSMIEVDKGIQNCELFERNSAILRP